MAVKIIIASARHDENGKYTNGLDGDQLQTSTNDTKGEVSMQNMYNHSKGWRVIRLKSVEHAEKIKERMIAASNNENIGYDQNDRLEIVRNGIDTNVPTDCDCGTLVRQAFKETTGIDPGNFTTANAETKIEATGLVEEAFDYVSQENTPIYDGDILCTKVKGHIAVVVGGNSRITEEPKFVEGQKVKLKKGAKFSNGKQPQSWVYERVLYIRELLDGDKAKVSIYEVGAITGTVYTKDLVSLEETLQEVMNNTYYPKYTGKSISLDTILKDIGVPAEYRGNYKARKPLAEKNKISNYRGTIKENSTLKELAKSGKLLKV